MSKEIKEEAERIIELFKGHHIILTSNSRGKPCSPYTSGLVGNDTIEKQAINFALIYCDGIMRETSMDSTNFQSYRDYLIIDRVYDYYEQVKEYIQNNY